MDLTTVRVRPMVNGWKVEAVGAAGPAALRETKEDALQIAHAKARGTLSEIVVLDAEGRVESRYPLPSQDVDGA
jgi:hypothetical protein